MTGSQPPPVRPGWCSDAPHLGMDGRPHRHRMGLRPLELAEWLEPDRNAMDQLALKATLLDEQPDSVLYDAETPAGRQAVVDLANLLTRDPRRPGPAPPPADGRATRVLLRACALATQEDWCLMVREDTWRLRAACVCFPSRWVLREKEGATVAAIHGPVPRYDDELRGLVEAGLDRLAPDRPVWRLNWNIWDDPRLFQPTIDPAASRWELPAGPQVGERVVLRVERQTLRRLPSGAVAFGIRVHQRPLRTLVDQEGAIDVLHRTLTGLEASPSGEKKLGRLYDPVLEWVECVRNS